MDVGIMASALFGQMSFKTIDISEYKGYAQIAAEQFLSFDEARRYMLVNEIEPSRIEKVLDVGCGAGQEMLPFAEKTSAKCIGIDIGKEVAGIGNELFRNQKYSQHGEFFRAKGENLPFADNSFDVVICRLALPYMNYRKTLAEISRVLKQNGNFFLKIHAPRFYFGMICHRAATLSPKQLAYPLISLFGGTFNLLTGKQPEGEFWKGKEIFLTEKLLKKELAAVGLKIKKNMLDNNAETPSFLIIKTK